MMSGEQADTLQAVKRWLRLRNKEGDAQLCADIDHSALLQRLLDGVELLPYRPPRAGSYPWYDLAETGRGEVWSLWEWPYDGGRLCIEGCPEWAVVAKVGDQTWVVRWPPSGEVFLVVPLEVRYGRQVWSITRQEEGTCAVL